MLNNTENIEARLCAFVEGDLDEHAKAEIEKHLETHPAHRALLDELKRTKAMMLALPRELAPVDMAETLQGHLERSVLLDGVGTGDLDSTLRISRWPQFMSVAAVLALAVGLGVLVYVVLPAHSSSPVSFAMKPKVKGAPGTMNSEDKAIADAMREDKELGKIGTKASDGTIAPPALLEQQAEGGSPPGSEFSMMKDRTRRPATPIDALAGAAGMNKPAGDGAAMPARRIYVVVSTDNLQTTNGQLANYLTAQNIAWQPAERGSLLDASGAVASRLSNTQYQLTIAPNNSLDSNNLAGGNGGGGGNGIGLFGATTQPVVNVGQQANGMLQNVKVQQAQNKAGDYYGQQYSQLSNGNYAAKGDVAANKAADDKVAELTARQAAAQALPSFDLASSKTENVIIARHLTRQQAAELSDSLGKLYAGQTAVMVDHDAVDAVTKTVGSRDAANTKARDYLSDQSRLIEGFPVVSSTQPTTLPLSDAVAGHGAPTTEPSAAAPGSPAAPAMAASTPKAANDGVAADRPDAAPMTPATLPTGMPSVVLTPADDLSLKPTPATQTSPATMPTAADLDLKPQPATQPVAEEHVDVVIVVQPTAIAQTVGEMIPAPASPAMPATQPATPDLMPPTISNPATQPSPKPDGAQ